MNFLVTGLGLGMQQLNVFPAGQFIISIPWTKLGIMLENLKEMNIEELIKLTPGPGGPAHRERFNKLLEGLRREVKQ